nr:proprotein convertase subtilisin/kexin type 5-like [Lytechinus pictus]
MSKTVVKNREKHSFIMASWRTCATLAAFTLVAMCVWCVIAEEVFTHHFALIVRGGQTKADRLAEKYGYINHGQIGALEDHYLFSHQNVFKRSAEASTGEHIDIADEPEVEWFEQQVSRKRVKRDMTRFSDPLWPNQWYLDGNFSGDSKPIASMNIQQAWDKGYTGAGIVITIMDDGLEYTHTDIKNSYDAGASYDFISRDADAMPRYMRAPNPEENMHGTRCAGEIVMQPNNNLRHGFAQCAGKQRDAPNFQENDGSILSSGIRMLDGLVTDEMESSSLSFNYQHVDIYSASWGPDDEGFTVEGPNILAKKALEKGVKLVTTDLHDGCIGNFTGTSASAPIAAGIVSLVLEANGNLTWRDVQYLIVVTSKRHQLTGDWMTNGAGYEVSHWFGFGLMDAAAMVEKAKTWEYLPEQLTYSKFADNVNQGPRNRRFFNRGPRYFTSSLEVQDCKDPFAGKPIRYLEHVQVTLSLRASVRGKVKVELTSPSGTTSTLLSNRTNDVAGKGFRLWTLMTVHFWGENPNGAWLIKIGNGEYNRLTVSTVRLTLRGTSSLPASLLPSHTMDTLEHIETEQEEREDQGAELPLDPQRSSGRHPQISPLRVVSETLQRDVRAASSSYSWDSSWWWSSSDWESYQQCHEECLYGCSGPNADECYKCRHYKDRETLDCVATCPDGQFTPPELHIRCGRCSDHCKTCSGNTKQDCLSCPPGLFLSDRNSCVRDCSPGYYKGLCVFTTIFLFLCHSNSSNWC